MWLGGLVLSTKENHLMCTMKLWNVGNKAAPFSKSQPMIVKPGQASHVVFTSVLSEASC